MQKELEECRETYSQAKRRRMLQFNSQDSDQSLSNEEMSLSYLKNVSGCSAIFGLSFHIRSMLNGSNGALRNIDLLLLCKTCKHFELFL